MKSTAIKTRTPVVSLKPGDVVAVEGAWGNHHGVFQKFSQVGEVTTIYQFLGWEKERIQVQELAYRFGNDPWTVHRAAKMPVPTLLDREMAGQFVEPVYDELVMVGSLIKEMR
jgi:hypothetical protein